MQIKPIISIITVAYNAESTIENTILSVINQTYTNIEYIVIDGGSTDKTVEIIKRYSNRISYWISEPDKGIYDAMNKGIKLATGKWINFMNCGDTFYDKNVITNLLEKADKDSDIIYGNTNLIYSFGNYLKIGKNTTTKDYMPFCHQSSFNKTEILKKLMFNLEFKICADRNFYYLCNKQGYTFEYVDIIIANYEAENGLSSTNSIKQRYETGVIENVDKKLGWNIKFYTLNFYYYFSLRFKRILPPVFVQYLRKKKLERRNNS